MKNLYLLIAISVFASVSLLIQSCKPGENNKPSITDFPVPQEVKDYMYFKLGTYWIYQDSITGTYDTVRVTDQYTISQTTNGNYFEQSQTNTHSLLDGYDYKFYVNTSFSDDCILNSNGNGSCYKIMIIKTKSGDYVGEDYFMFYKINIGYWGYSKKTDKSIITMTDYKDSLSINGSVYRGVVQVHNNENYLFDNSETNFYIAKNIGTVRKEIKSKNQVWNLVNYKIYQ